MNWRKITLGEICSPKQWKTISKKQLLKEGYPVYGANGRIGFSEKFTHEKPIILVGCRGTCGSINVTEPYSYANGNAMALDSLDESKVDLYFLKYILQNRGFKDVISGSSQPQITRQNIVRVEIPLPPIEEQQRIAKILNTLSKLVNYSENFLSKSYELINSLFMSYFGDLTKNQKQWSILSTSDIFKDPPRIGTIKPAEGIGNLVVRVGELGNKEINIKNCGRVKLSNDEIEKYKLLKGDIILARAIGSEKQLGKASFFDGFEEDIVIDSHVMRLRINSDLCLPIWFYYLITSPHGKFLIQNSGGQTSVQFNINSRQISSIKIPLPPIKIQTEFINLVNKIEKQQQKYYKKLNNLNELKNSLFEELLRT